MQENFARTSSSWVFLVANPSLNVCHKLEKARSRKLLAANQFTTGESRNKVVSNKSWFTVLVLEISPKYGKFDDTYTTETIRAEHQLEHSALVSIIIKFSFISLTSFNIQLIETWYAYTKIQWNRMKWLKSSEWLYSQFRKRHDRLTQWFFHFLFVQHDIPGSLPAAGVVGHASSLLPAMGKLLKDVTIYQICLIIRDFNTVTIYKYNVNIHIFIIVKTCRQPFFSFASTKGIHAVVISWLYPSWSKYALSVKDETGFEHPQIVD